MPAIQHARILFIATNGFEESELFGPYEALRDAGAAVTLASLTLEPIQGETGDVSTRAITPDMTVQAVNADDYDGLILPGGTRNPDALRMDATTVGLIRTFADAGKPVASICHGPWLLVEADVLRGRRATSWPSIRTDLRNAGADVVDQDVVVSGNIITSRMPEDVPAFTRAFIRLVEMANLPPEQRA